MPLYEVRKTLTLAIWVDADSAEEAQKRAIEIPGRQWRLLENETTIAVEETELPY